MKVTEQWFYKSGKVKDNKKMKYFVSWVLVKLIGFGKRIAKIIINALLKLEGTVQLVIKEKQEMSFQADWLPERKERVCHFNELYITHKGNVFPCCTVWNRPDMKIGHVDDEKLLESIEGFYSGCTSCEEFKLKKGSPQDKKEYCFNIELSLACQGKCAMCCVEAPSWKGKYDYYESCTKIIDLLKPKELLLQGGEVLVQKKSLEWVAEVKHNHPDIVISLVTNANADLSMVETVENLFDKLYVSIVGFQAETYKRIMGMDFEKTVKFVEELSKRKKIKLVLKYLTTPLNIHEANLFLKWAINLEPALIYFDDADTLNHIKYNAPFDFWNKIIKRTANEIKMLLISNKDKLNQKNIAIQFRPNYLILIGFNEDFNKFVTENGLTKVGMKLS